MDLTALLNDPAARRILHERARSLARREHTTDTIAEELFVYFALGTERYSIPAATAREVLRITRIAPLPAVPPAILGLVNVRGRLLVCIDLRPLLGLPAMPFQPTMHILVVHAAGIEAALLVDQVVAVQAEAVTLHPTPATIAGGGVSWVRGVDDHLVIHLDPIGLLSDSRLAVNARELTPHRS
ncbi:MAG: chemotaxis protein CheW [Chloroflexus sp.]|uniref:chemotaxis protein CheW n=1 Tax=Chloroflexus sp. TaxID=1904827 RepID=UPI0021DF4104|nr:chemotaxis protein CheW [Chloroflexus sp.]GIV88154.1 MAG: chemotaxis protein CheW [Chloroflexus sp.]GIV88167.1 MAG: chemotaxis protein CheW [Chloroflexus sp.]